MTSYNPPYQAAIPQGLTVVYEDAHLLALDKPAGLLSVPGRGEDKQDCLARRVQAAYPGARIVHRLDMATSGLILMARSELMQSQLGKLFEQRQIEKTYIALVAGRLDKAAGEIDLPLITDWPNRPRQMVDHTNGKPALTRFRRLNYDAALDVSRVELKPQTGRSHQLRVHMQALGHPILGDPLYAPLPVQEKSPRLALHAETLAFLHPATQAALTLHRPAPF